MNDKLFAALAKYGDSDDAETVDRDLLPVALLSVQEAGIYLTITEENGGWSGFVPKLGENTFPVSTREMAERVKKHRDRFATVVDTPYGALWQFFVERSDSFDKWLFRRAWLDAATVGERTREFETADAEQKALRPRKDIDEDLAQNALRLARGLRVDGSIPTAEMQKALLSNPIQMGSMKKWRVLKSSWCSTTWSVETAAGQELAFRSLNLDEIRGSAHYYKLEVADLARTRERKVELAKKLAEIDGHIDRAQAAVNLGPVPANVDPDAGVGFASISHRGVKQIITDGHLVLAALPGFDVHVLEHGYGSPMEKAPIAEVRNRIKAGAGWLMRVRERSGDWPPNQDHTWEIQVYEADEYTDSAHSLPITYQCKGPSFDTLWDAVLAADEADRLEASTPLAADKPTVAGQKPTTKNRI